MRRTIYLLLTCFLFFTLDAIADEPKSFDERFNEVKDKASNGGQPSADKINTPQRIDERPVAQSPKEESSALPLILIGALILGVVVMSDNSNDKTIKR